MMAFRDVVRAALMALGTNRLRSLLTVFGVIMGVASVMLLVSIGNGASRKVLQRITSLGANLLFVSPVARYGAALTLQDPGLIRKAVPLPVQVFPVVSTGAAVNYQGLVQGAPLQGVVAGFDQARSDLPAKGRFIRQADVSTNAKVVDLGAALAQDLFDGTNPVGRSVYILGQLFRVIGVMQPKGASFGVNLDNVAFMPITTAQEILGTDQVSTLVVQAPDVADASLAQNMIGRLYTQRYQTPLAMTVQSEDAVLSAVATTRQTFSDLLAGTASIALLVGGIGIMNIMLVSVTERTREIGIRKAVGAKRDDILSQFLLEAMLLSVSGGVFGIVFGFLAVPIIPHLLPFTPAVSLPSVVIAFLFSALVGVVFGFYPALRASSTYPVEALRQG